MRTILNKKFIPAALLGLVMLLGCASPGSSSPEGSRITRESSIPAGLSPGLTPRPGPTPAYIELGLATWNIENFDGAGPEDNTVPTRSERNLRQIASILLQTRADIIGLEEIYRKSPFQDTAPPRLIVDAMNKLEEEKSGMKLSFPVWKWVMGETEGKPNNDAFLWNDSKVELLGFRELADLRVGYTKVRIPAEELRFPRIPLAARFRLREAPGFDLQVIVLHLKASGSGFGPKLDRNDKRRRGELESLYFDWIAQTEAQGELRDEDMVILGDLNETNRNLVDLLDEFGTRPESKGILTLSPDRLPSDRPGFLFADAVLFDHWDYSFMGNAQRGEVSRYNGNIYAGDTVSEDWAKLIDHILISPSLVKKWDGQCYIEYFERDYPVHDHVHFSDHRPVTIFLRIPK